jgi:hypothetical protein
VKALIGSSISFCFSFPDRAAAEIPNEDFTLLSGFAMETDAIFKDEYSIALFRLIVKSLQKGQA